MKKILITSLFAISLISMGGCASSQCDKCSSSGKSAQKTTCCKSEKKQCPMGY